MITFVFGKYIRYFRFWKIHSLFSFLENTFVIFVLENTFAYIAMMLSETLYTGTKSIVVVIVMFTYYCGPDNIII